MEDPATSLDFMGYADFNRWISPYTYLGLMQRLLPTSKLSTGDSPVNREKRQVLFLGLTIDRRRTVTRRPSFHFPARTFDPLGRPTPFQVEFLDDCRRTLVCHTLGEDDATCEHSCWPKRFYEKIPYPRGARWLVVHAAEIHITVVGD